MTDADKEREALKLLHRGFDDMPAHHQQALHHTLLFTIEALMKVGLVESKEESNDT